MSEAADPAFERLLDFLKRNRGLDFTGYKRASLDRRFRRRMEVVLASTFDEYLDYLEVHPDEYRALFDTLLINVTEFFRDAPVWDFVQAEVVPALLRAKRPAEPIRVWSAACAGGQEAYTIAMVLAEALGPDAFRDQVKIYATDIDEDALATARLGLYSAKEIESVPAELRERYFERADSSYSFRKDLRRSVIFGRNNLVSDAPISRLDLLVCRNTLMYFTADTQERILRNFRFALGDHGVLVLGKSEMMVSNRELFAPVDLRRRVFRAQAGEEPLRRQVAALGEVPVAPGADGVAVDAQAARDAALELAPDARVVLTPDGVLSYANRSARRLFGVDVADVGRPFAELALARRPADLGAAVQDAMHTRREVEIGEVGFHPTSGDELRLDVAVTPLLVNGGEPLGVTVTYVDVTRYSNLRAELETHRRDLELAYEELQSTIDELETTNEELQSANEELQTTNEELQSTNEELETMNEELQSTNEELETINDELRDRTSELNQVNAFFETILGSLRVGIAVVDGEETVQVWSRRAEDLWGVRADEAIERRFLSLDIGLPTDALAPALHEVLGGGTDGRRLIVDAVNRRGRLISCTVTVLPLSRVGGGLDGHSRGAIVLMEDGQPGDSDG